MNILSKLINDSNSELWNKINDREKVKVILWNESFSELYTAKNTLEIRLNKICISTFNHELCHLYIHQVIGGIFPDLNIRLPYELREYVPRDCIQHMANTIEHKLFYNLYLDIGGEKNKFVADYDSLKGNNFHVYMGELTLNNLHFYLGNLFSILGDCNEFIDYKDILRMYKDLNPKIFEASNLLFSNILELGIKDPVDEFVFTDNGIIMNETIGSYSEKFWDVVFEQVF